MSGYRGRFTVRVFPLFCIHRCTSEKLPHCVRKKMLRKNSITVKRTKMIHQKG